MAPVGTLMRNKVVLPWKELDINKNSRKKKLNDENSYIKRQHQTVSGKRSMHRTVKIRRPQVKETE